MEKALAILGKCPELPIDRQLVIDGALLHDIGIGQCHAPKIKCNGTQPYIAHGIIGAEMLRRDFPEMEACARICERHTGSGITAEQIRQRNLPLPIQDFLPETLEEKLVCLADKFFSKSGDMLEEPIDAIRRELAFFGADSLQRFDDYCQIFHIQPN